MKILRLMTAVSILVLVLLGFNSTIVRLDRLIALQEQHQPTREPGLQ